MASVTERMDDMNVLLGLSGGVDSAVAAYVLKQQGHEVTCAFMRNWDSFANNDIKGNPTIQDDVCPQEQDYADAKAVAERLGLPLLRVDFVKDFSTSDKYPTDSLHAKLL